MALKVSHDLDKEAAEMQQKGRLLRVELWRVVRIVSFNLEREVKFTLPVDTGRLRASWSHWTAADLVPGRKTDASPTDAIFKESAADFSTEQGTNVHYLQYVGEEQGKGPQFKGKTVDELHKDHQEQLDRLVDDLIDRIL